MELGKTSCHQKIRVCVSIASVCDSVYKQEEVPPQYRTKKKNTYLFMSWLSENATK